MAEKRPLKAALAGCRSVSQGIIPPHGAMEDVQAAVELVGVCDLDAERAQRVAETFNIPGWRTDLPLALQQDNPDLVPIATPAGSHFGLGLQAVEAGKHVCMQKTITSTVEEADKRMRAGTFGTGYWAIATSAFIGHEYESFRMANPVDPTWDYTSPGGGPIRDMAVYAPHTRTSLPEPARQVTAMSGIGLPVRQWEGREYAVSTDDKTILLIDFGDARFGVVTGQFCYVGGSHSCRPS